VSQHTLSYLDVSYNVPFEAEVVSRMEDAIICGLYPELGKRDRELIDFLQPEDIIYTYSKYEVDKDTAKSLGRDILRRGLPTTDTSSYLCLSDYSREYVAYIEYVGLENLPKIHPTKDPLSTLHNRMTLAIRRGDGDDENSCRDIREVTMPDLWDGRHHPNSGLVERLRNIVIEMTYSKLLREADRMPTGELCSYINIFCPHILSSQQPSPFSLPWGARLEEDDPRSRRIEIICQGKILLKNRVVLPEIPYDPYDSDSGMWDY
jgi:hypothetical protein